MDEVEGDRMGVGVAAGESGGVVGEVGVYLGLDVEPVVVFCPVGC